jgi:hypothetical protein
VLASTLTASLLLLLLLKLLLLSCLVAWLLLPSVSTLYLLDSACQKGKM